MTAVALYTFGLLDPAAGPAALADFVRRGGEIMRASDLSPGFLGRATKRDPGEDDGSCGRYLLPDVPEFAGHDPHLHIATLSLWCDLESARAFVYHGVHRDALRIRYDWFLKGSWPGYVLWRVEDATVPSWSDGVRRYEELARAGESADGFSFSSPWARG